MCHSVWHAFIHFCVADAASNIFALRKQPCWAWPYKYICWDCMPVILEAEQEELFKVEDMRFFLVWLIYGRRQEMI